MSVVEHNIPPFNIETTRHTPLKVHTDASIREGIAAIGIVFKNHVGKIIGRYNEIIGADADYDVELAEQTAIDRAVEILDDVDPINHVKLYTDRTGMTSKYSLDEFEYGTVEHVPREENYEAHLQAGGAIIGLP